MAILCALVFASLGLFVHAQFGIPQPGAQPINPLQPIPVQTRPAPSPFNPNQNQVIQQNSWVYATCSFNNSNPYVQTQPNFRGKVDLRQMSSGGPVYARVQIEGLPRSMMSDTERGMHIHEYGDTVNSCYAAGPHYDSDTFSFHGAPNNRGNGNSHEGDMGNFRQSNYGIIDAEVTFPNMVISGDRGVIGRAVVLKEGRDDLGRGGNSMSLQTGNSGAPISCCVLGYADSSSWSRRIISNNQFNPNTQQNTNNFG